MFGGAAPESVGMTGNALIERFLVEIWVVVAVVMMTVVMVMAVHYHHYLRLSRIGHRKTDKEKQGQTESFHSSL